VSTLIKSFWILTLAVWASVAQPEQFPVRVTGQLFFDASHKLCTNGKAVGGNPARQSAWEIHPVYQADVCRHQTLSECEADQADVWIPITDWKPTGN
jgi:hypothetical protein